MPQSPPEPVTLLPMIKGLVWKRFRAVPAHVADYDDLVQIAMEAVCSSAKRWAPDRDTKFTTYAGARAIWAVQDYLRQTNFGRRNYAEFNVVSFDETVGEGGMTRLDEYVATVGVEDDWIDPFVREGIEEALKGTSLDAQSAFALIQEEQLTFMEVSRMMGVSESRVCQMVKEARKAIAAHPAVRALIA